MSLPVCSDVTVNKNKLLNALKELYPDTDISITYDADSDSYVLENDDPLISLYLRILTDYNQFYLDSVRCTENQIQVLQRVLDTILSDSVVLTFNRLSSLDPSVTMDKVSSLLNTLHGLKIKTKEVSFNEY